MVRDLLCDEFLLFILLWLCVTWYGRWHRSQSVPCQSTSTLAKSSQKRSQHQRPFPGLIPKPPCEACERLAEPSHPTSSAPPPQLTSVRGRRRAVITQHHFCPHPSCDYYGWD
jgi:hypothetical protein